MEPLSNIEVFQRLAIAMALGAVLGLERERADKPAGIRTYMLVCEGAALFMILAILLADALAAAGVASDPGRIASTVVQGIGFLAGGVILTTGRRVRGLTTAAGIWVAAALGLLVGAGFAFIAAVATGATILALIVLHWVAQRLPLAPPESADGETRDGGGSEA